MSIIHSSDPDFRLCQINFDTLVEIQKEAEDRGWATRWSSVDALSSQVSDGNLILQTLLRERLGEAVRAYRCLVLFPTVDGGGTGGVATIDISPERLESLERFDRDPEVRKIIFRIFSLAMSGISMVPKK